MLFSKLSWENAYFKNISFQQPIRDSHEMSELLLQLFLLLFFFRYYLVLVFPMGVTHLDTKWYKMCSFIMYFYMQYITILLHNEIPNLVSVWECTFQAVFCLFYSFTTNHIYFIFRVTFCKESSNILGIFCFKSTALTTRSTSFCLTTINTEIMILMMNSENYLSSKFVFIL